MLFALPQTGCVCQAEGLNCLLECELLFFSCCGECLTFQILKNAQSNVVGGLGSIGDVEESFEDQVYSFYIGVVPGVLWHDEGCTVKEAELSWRIAKMSRCVRENSIIQLSSQRHLLIPNPNPDVLSFVDRLILR